MLQIPSTLTGVTEMTYYVGSTRYAQWGKIPTGVSAQDKGHDLAAEADSQDLLPPVHSRSQLSSKPHNPWIVPKRIRRTTCHHYALNMRLKVSV